MQLADLFVLVAVILFIVAAIAPAASAKAIPAGLAFFAGSFLWFLSSKVG